jgi:pimeloyl-ACP methyl ester carboxylesterase
MKDIKETDIEVFYEDFKSIKNNETILILHWWWWNSQSWLHVWELLFNNWYNVIIPDLPWFGNTKLNKILELDDYASIVENFIINQKLDNIILWWHSNGWAIAIKIANRNKINIKRLILNNSAWIRNDSKRSIKRKIFNKISVLLKNILPKNNNFIKKLRIYYYKAIWSYDYIEAEKSPIMKQTYLNMISSDLKTEINKIKQNTLLIWWKNDTYTPISDGMYMRQHIKKSKMIIIENEKHWIHIASPEKLVNNFLKNL